MRQALIALEDGRCFSARCFAGKGEIEGEIVFNTSMTGYQEILTDPSYNGQIVTLTYPLVGNYGINRDDVESSRIRVNALVIGEHSRVTSNWRSHTSLADYLDEAGVMGIDDVDTRAITLHIRSRGAMKCMISTVDLDRDSLVAKAKASRGLVGIDIASEVSTRTAYDWPEEGEVKRRVAVLDCGVKFNIVRELARRGCAVRVYPIDTPAEAILADAPDGIMVSNGPGDPAALTGVIEQLRILTRSGTPTMGICFGHQLLCLALGGKTFKMKFGHRGANHPVKNLATGRIEITTQNHGFCVDADSLDTGILEVTHINLNDQSLEGVRHRELPVFSVQHHPEAAAGPHDAAYLFEEFVTLIDTRGGKA